MVYSYKYAKAFGIFLKTGVMSTVYLNISMKIRYLFRGFFFIIYDIFRHRLTHSVSHLKKCSPARVIELSGRALD